MEYVEMLRARRVLVWFCGIVLALACLGLALVFKDGSPHFQMSHDSNPRIPFDGVLAGAAIAPLIIASFLGVGLDAEYKTTAIAWTRPIARLAIAARFIAIDFAAMIVAWLFCVAIALFGIFLLGISKYLVFETDALHFILIAFGCAVMWYGLIVFFAALLPGRGNAVVGMSWAYALIVPGLSKIPFPTLLHQVVSLLDYINPLAYMGNLGGGGSIIIGTGTQHVVAAWLIGAAAIAIGTRIWSNREVPA